MNTDSIQVFDRTVQETSVWLKEIMEEIGPDRQRAYHALRATLHTLRDRLTVDEATDLGAQLPLLVRGIYYEGWRPSETPEKYRSKEEFLRRISDRLGAIAPINSETAARAVFETLTRHVSAGEIDDVKQMLPHDLRPLWSSPTTPGDDRGGSSGKRS